jgi:serine/threonine protein kinase
MSQSAAVSGQRESYSDSFALLVEDLTARVQGGEPLDVDAFLEAHPENAEQLRRLLPALLLLAEVSRSGDGPAPGEATRGFGSPKEELGDLGDFRIIREVGRGGMGIVYEAEQISLGRRVALKVLPFAATMDPRHLQRFHNEARAAAGLHHTNIVPVYAVGCERGVHYYSMQFIEGHTLGDFIAQQRGSTPSQVPRLAQSEVAASASTVPPAAQATSSAPRDTAYFRRVAEWGIQAAEALDHAHTLGVVHRDIKPANLLVDAAGRIWVTDFGLAHVQSDARLTTTGDLVGTLRYMSPEQALAQRVVIDHRTDVYSLGATLYELLTLQPAFAGGDRQELLRQIAFEEPKPPRRVNKAIPADLESIVLKAMEKDAPERYATAREFADDLRRFLQHEPIRAKRPNLLQQGRKLALRHKSAVAAAVGVMGVAVVGLTIGTYLLWQQEAQTRAALKQVAEQRRKAEADLNEALNVMQDLPRVLHHKDLAELPGIGRVRQALAAYILRHYRSYLEESSADPEVRYRTARTYQSVGNLYSILGEQHKARDALDKSVALSEALTREFPVVARYWMQLGHYRFHLAEVLAGQGLKPQATEAYLKSVAAFETAARLAPDDARMLTNLACHLAISPVPTIRDPARAVVIARRAVELAPDHDGIWDALGVACYRNGDWSEAATALERSLVLRPKRTTIGDDKAAACFYLAMAYGQLGQDQMARSWYDKAVHWSDSNEPQHEGLYRLRAEATSVLGVKDRPETNGRK